MTTNATSTPTSASTAPADYDTWVPTKGEYTDEELIATPLFERIKATAVVNVPGGKKIHLANEQVLPLAREAVAEMWTALQTSRFSDGILAVFDALDAAGIEHGDEVIIRRIEGVGSYKLVKGQGRKRFSHEGYARLISFGEDDSSETYKNAVEKLKKAGYNPAKDLNGGFLLIKNQMKNPSKNGVFELVIEEGDPNNKLAANFKATLYQFPDNKAKVPAIVFPPASGDKTKCTVNDSITEVPSMSRMMKESILQGAQTPAVMFDLVARLKALGVDESEVTEDGAEDGEEEATEEQAASQPAPTTAAKPAAQPAKKGSAKSLADE